MFLSPVLSKFAIEKNEENMATITLTLSARTSKDTGKAEILLRYRNTREVALRAHTRVFILPKYFVDGQIVIKNRLITPEVKEAQEAKALIERIINHLTEKGYNVEIIHRDIDKD